MQSSCGSFSPNYAEKTAVTLDICSDIEDKNFELLKQVPHGIPTYTYIPLEQFRLIGVFERTIPVWNSTNKHEICTKVSVCTKDGPKFVHLVVITPEGIETLRYFVKGLKMWREVKENTFFSLFDELALTKSVLEYVTLNIGTEMDKSHFYINATPDKPYKIIIPYAGFVLSRVFDGINTIWKSRSYDDHCTYVNIFYVDRRPELVYLIISSKQGEERLFFKKVLFGAWKDLTKHEYLQCIKQTGFNVLLFNNNINFDINNPDLNRFRAQRTFNMNVLSEIYTPLPGYSLKKVAEDKVTVWESNNVEQCIFIRLFSRDKNPFLCHLLVTDSKTNRILYYIKNGDDWDPVDKAMYHFVLSNKDDPIYTHREVGVDSDGDRKLIMSHFRNKQGLLIRTYSSKVENAKGNIILIHGSWGHFKSQFCSYDIDWHYERYGYPILPYMKDFINVKMDSFYKDLNFDHRTSEVYKDIFGWTKLDGVDAFEVSPRFQYRGTFLESLNNMGYNVYGMDLQSHGLSECVSEARFYIHDFKDYVNDVLQFVDIVKRGNFLNTKEVWRDDFVYSVSSDNIDNKCYLSGYSLGGNIAIQAVQEFYKHAKPGVKFVEGVFILSGMLNIDNNLDTFAKKFTIAFIKFIAFMTPMAQNPLENTFSCSDSIEMFSRYKDPTYYNDRLFYRTVEMLFGACKEVLRNMKYYPDKLPTLFIHVTDDPLCDVNGQRNVVYNYLKGRSDVKLVELHGNSHYLTSCQFFPNVTPIINEWFLAHSSKSSLTIK